MKYGFVYIWRDKKHNKYYVGSHWGTETDGYLCSSNSMREAHRRRREDFKRRILVTSISSKKETFDEEQRWLNMISDDELGIRYYNRCKYAKYHWSQDAYKVVWNKGLTGIYSEEILQKNRQAHVGKVRSAETRHKTSETLKQKYANGWITRKGLKNSEESNEKRSRWNKENNWKPADGVGRKFQKGHIPWNKSCGHTEETKRKISETKRKRYAAQHH